ncbi:ubiquitin carboxyl-terminal hydrolase 8-like [Diospyros lotus]|uniref:ubiquitin carboxyl-terminal hydrolase 8-like n=1 Tax=Diospyros lotus TaxID=55363 RepID=UPI0022530DAF|nr:ubiquitin carboxyl-terminal hydrolase 8-like [Diospyros lotus]XP_052198811.1 ubiquitin carboxyl-terminal hydrolase 8-like [Diospyros lotus]
MTNRPPPNQDCSPPSSSSSSQSTTRLTHSVRFSLSRFANFLSFLLSPFLKRLLSKTLDFISMDSFLFSSNDGDGLFDRDAAGQTALADVGGGGGGDDEKLYFVPFRWWSEAKEALFRGTADVEGVSYAVKSYGAASGPTGIGGHGSEIALSMRRKDDSLNHSCEEEGAYALLAQWMFLRALKWHNDAKEIEGLLAAEDNMWDLFPLQISLSVCRETNSLVVKIRQKDNEIADFRRAFDIFNVETGQLTIWDFSGQTTQLFIHDRIKLSDDSNQQNEEMHLELQVYGSSHLMSTREGRKHAMAAKQSMVGNFLHNGPLKMNGNIDHVNSYFRVNNAPGSTYREGCNLGLTGLYNLGNTCFMNSAIQCLVHTPELVDYFLGDYRKDINSENPLGMKGELALQFGDLLRKLWAPGAAPVSPSVFKLKLSAFAPQFSGYNQHDSQEFLAFLLDGLHEDLNRVKCKPYIEAKDAEGRHDDEVAEEYWQNHLARNNSIIVDLCQGQYRSTLVCPVCKKLSITFDPFMYLSLPLPSTTMRSMTLTVLSTDGTTLPCPVAVNVPKYGRCKDLVQALSTMCYLSEDETLLVAEIFNNRILHFLDKPSDTIELIRDDDCLVAYRLPKGSETSPLVVFMNEYMEGHYMRATSSKMFGTPLVARMSDLSRGSNIRKEFLKLLNPFLMTVEDSLNDDNGQHSADEDIEMEDIASSRLLDRDANSGTGLDDDSELGADFQFYLTDEKGSLKGPKIQMNEPVPKLSTLSRIVRVLVCWPEKMSKIYDTCLLSTLPQICKSGLLQKHPQEFVTLYKCLEAFLKEEPLGPEDMWYCPNCKKHRQASKKLDLWRLPEILIIHLKRFSYSRFFKNKLETFVDFPVEDLHLSDYIANKNIHASHGYMLYAVCNHYGGMGGGHYTAFVQLGNGQWYEFDDSHVSRVSENEIKTSAAYVLFYKRITDV